MKIPYRFFRFIVTVFLVTIARIFAEIILVFKIIVVRNTVGRIFVLLVERKKLEKSNLGILIFFVNVFSFLGTGVNTSKYYLAPSEIWSW